MGLDISLIRIRKEKTTDTNWLAVEDCPELNANYAGYALEKEFKDEGEENYTGSVYYYEEIAYQRKGVIKSFYDRYAHDVFIQSQNEIEELRQYIIDEYLPTFERDFIEKFIEGENLIIMGY